MANWRKSREYRIWRASVLRRDKRCVICGAIKTRHAHHIHGAKYFPELKYEVDNGVCLCGHCHMNFHCNYKKSYREKCDMDDFCNFEELVKNMVVHFAQLEADTLVEILSKMAGLPDEEAAKILENNLWDLV